MKKLVIAFALAAVTAFAAEKKDQYDIRPEADVGKAPSAVDWQRTNDAALKSATGESVLAAFVADDAAATALLAQVKGAYVTDPVAAFQIAAVSQWVMLPDPWYCLLWDGPHQAGRKVWLKALMARITGTDDDYVKQFCLDQIRWCGCPCMLDDLRKYAAGEKSKAVKELAEIAIRELEGKAIGL